MAENLYVHFPFCRRKCTYCALLSRAGVQEGVRNDYARALAHEIATRADLREATFGTVYFGGGSPALCDLAPLFDALAPHLADNVEFTVELHPQDVADASLATLAAGGVNRISLGVQSLDDRTLAAMRRGYSAADARRAFDRVRHRFENAGIDLILGYPGDPCDAPVSLADWGLAHCSVYSLILEERSALARLLARPPNGDSPPPVLPDDDAVMDKLRVFADRLHAFGLFRYEISNYARPGRECRHNLAVWRGEDYFGLGEGACGRLGLVRTQGTGPATETRTSVTPGEDRTERALFRLRTREGLDATRFPDRRDALDRFVGEGLLTRDGDIYRLTDRGTEVCDSILAELV